MDKINFQDGTKTSSAKVTIDEVDYPVTPARYTGATPLSSLVMNTMQTNIENAINQNVDNIGGEEYDNTATYEEGDIVKYQGQLYICIEAIETAEDWDSTKWSETDVLSSAGGNEVTIGTSADITSKTKIFIDESEGTDAYSEVVNSLSGNEIAKAPSVRAVNQALSYSTDETRIGTWIDGKPLYRKVYNCGELPNTTTKTINLEIENIDKVVRVYGEAISSTTSLTIPFVSTNYIYVAVNNNTSLEIGTNADRRAYIGYITIEYTKTTD